MYVANMIGEYSAHHNTSENPQLDAYLWGEEGRCGILGLGDDR
jgi:hypothetical protein